MTDPGSGSEPDSRGRVGGSDDAAEFVARLSPDVVRVGLGTGSPEGENGAYVLPDRGVVVDPGPPTDAAWERLVAGVEAAGLAVEEVVLVLATHWHADHAGLAPRLAEAADATLAMHEADAPLVADYAAARERRLERDGRRLRAWGVPDERVAALQDADRASPMPDAFPVRELTDGECVLGVEVVHTPGHTLGGAAFAVDGDGVEKGSDGTPLGPTAPTLLVGDHVLPTYTPNVGGGDTRLFGFDDETDPGAVDPDNPSPLGLYLDALDRVVGRVDWDRWADVDEAAAVGGRGDGANGDGRGDGASGSGRGDATNGDDGHWDAGTANGDDGRTAPLVLPGHGLGVDLPVRSAEIERHHRTRSERVRDVVAERQGDGVDGVGSVGSGNVGGVGNDDGYGVTPWTVARDLFGEMDGIHAKMGAGEAAAHLADLRARGVVGVVSEEPVRYALVW